MTGRRLRIRSVDLRWEQLDDEVIILDLVGSTYLKLNGAGVVLWNALLDGAARRDLVHTLLGEYDIDPPTAERDVDAFLAKLSDAGLLETGEVR